jgi:hypothetical protein
MDTWTPPARGSESFTESVFGGSYRWAPEAEGSMLFLEREDLGRDFYAPPIALSHCTPRRLRPFTIIDCKPTVGALYRGEELVMVVAGSHVRGLPTDLLTPLLEASQQPSNRRRASAIGP